MICPRHGSNFDLRTGVPLSLPAFEPVATYPVDGRGRHGDGGGGRELKRCWETTDPQYNAYHDEEWGRPVHDRAGRLRAPVPRGLPVGALVDHDPAEAGGVPGGIRGIRPGARRPLRRAGRRAAARRRLDRPSPRQDRGGDRERPGDGRAAGGGHARWMSSSGRTARSRTSRRAPSPRSPHRRPSRRRSRRACGARASASSARRPPTRPCRPAASSTTTSRTAGCGTPSRPRERRGIRPDPSARLWVSAERRWSGVGDFKYGQWRYQLVEACPRDLTGTA